MLNLLENYGKPIKVNGKIYPDGRVAYAAHLKWDGPVEIELNWEEPVAVTPEPKQHSEELIITVRQYMTRPSTPQFDFHDKWNNGKPMPLRTMSGVILEETKGMYRMRLQGKPLLTKSCVKCGRKLTHPVSMNYGIGPECGGHFHIGPEMDIETIREKMESIVWEGWVIKSAITHKEKMYIEAI